MDENLSAPTPKRKPRFQFRLRTLFVVVTALCVLLAQWPWVVWAPPAFVQRSELSGWDRYALIDGPYAVPARVWIVDSVLAAALIGWLIWRRVRRAPLS